MAEKLSKKEAAAHKTQAAGIREPRRERERERVAVQRMCLRESKSASARKEMISKNNIRLVIL